MLPLALALHLALALGPRPGVVDHLTRERGFPSDYPRALAMTATDLWVGLGATNTPEGLGRIERAAAERAGDGAPLAAASVERFVHVGPAPLDAPPDLVNALGVEGADVWVATGRGLARWRLATRTFEVALDGAAVTGLSRAPDGAWWAAVAERGGFTAAPVEALATRAERPICRDAPLLLVARAADLAHVVCRDSLLVLGRHKGFVVDTVGTPLRLDEQRAATQRMAPMEANREAAAGDDGAVLVLTSWRTLVRWRDDDLTRVGELVEGFVADTGGAALAVTIGGVIESLGPGPARRVWPFGAPDARAGVAPLKVEGGRRWLTLEPMEGEHAVVRLDARGVTVWPLRRPGASYTSPGVLAALPDAQGGLWISTNDGLWRLR